MKEKNRGRLIAGKLIMDRARMHLSTVNFLMILYIFIVGTPYPFWVVLPLAGIGVFILGYLDYRFVFPREMQKTTTINPFMRDLKEDVNQLKKDLDEIKEMLKHANDGKR